MRKIFVTGINTDVGKTVVSAILTEALQADYWKPIQTGCSTDSDSLSVKELISNSQTKILSEIFKFEPPVSPHTAAELSHTRISLSQINLPVCSNENLIIEGAGGLMVPLNESEFIVDIIQKFDAETILVVKNYLGSINHTLLSIELLKQRGLKVLGLVFNGDENVSSEKVILNYSKIRCLGRVPQEAILNKEIIKINALLFKGL